MFWQEVCVEVLKGPQAVRSAGCCQAHPPTVIFPNACAVNLSVTRVLHNGVFSDKPSALEDQLRSFGELEAIGIRNEEKTLYDYFAGVVKFEDGRYRVPLPWREFHDPLHARQLSAETPRPTQARSSSW